jgi:hypothetical protein
MIALKAELDNIDEKIQRESDQEIESLKMKLINLT